MGQRSEGKAGKGSSSGSQEGKEREGKEGSADGDSRTGSPQGRAGTCTDFPSKGHEVAAGSPRSPEGGGSEAKRGTEGAESRRRSRCKGKGFAEPTEFNSIKCNRKSCTPERTCESNSKQRSEGKAGEESSSG